MIKYIKLLFLIIALNSCGNQSNDKTTEVDFETKSSTIQEIPNTINLSSFEEEEFPAIIDGCSCYFKEKGKESEGYIYVDDFSRSAFIKIGDTFEGLEIYEAHNEDGFVKHKCRAEHYGIDMDLTEVGHEDETWQYEGTMKVDKIDGSKMTLQIVGECGC